MCGVGWGGLGGMRERTKESKKARGSRKGRQIQFKNLYIVPHTQTRMHTRTHTHCAIYCNTLKTLWNTLQHSATHCNMWYYQFELTGHWHLNLSTLSILHPLHLFVRMCDMNHSLQYTSTHCNTLQHSATHCNTLQHTAHCNTLQHTYQYASARWSIIVS